MARNSLLCADVPLRNYSLTLALKNFAIFQDTATKLSYVVQRQNAI